MTKSGMRPSFIAVVALVLLALIGASPALADSPKPLTQPPLSSAFCPQFLAIQLPNYAGPVYDGCVVQYLVPGVPTPDQPAPGPTFLYAGGFDAVASRHLFSLTVTGQCGIAAFSSSCNGDSEPVTVGISTLNAAGFLEESLGHQTLRATAWPCPQGSPGHCGASLGSSAVVITFARPIPLKKGNHYAVTVATVSSSLGFQLGGPFLFNFTSPQ